MDIRPTPFDLWCSDFCLNSPLVWVGLVAVIISWIAARWSAHWIDRLDRDAPVFAAPQCSRCHVSLGSRWLGWFSWRRRCPACGASRRNELLLSTAIAALLTVHVLLVCRVMCQALVEGGSIDWIHWRVLSQSLLLMLLATATGIDFRQYLIPDEITFFGMVAGVATATLFGHIQLVPLWIDWNQEVAGLSGAYTPLWIRQHPHLHGLAWSLAGLVLGGGLTWLVRILSSWLLGTEAMGFGDVTLMAMIGSFVGWQAVLLIFAFAPLCGLVIAVSVRVLTGLHYVPYGPYLAFSTVVVLWTWRWLWTPLRYIFGHGPSIAGLAGGSIVLMCLLLGLWRLYLSLPVKGRNVQQ